MIFWTTHWIIFLVFYAVDFVFIESRTSWQYSSGGHRQRLALLKIKIRRSHRFYAEVTVRRCSHRSNFWRRRIWRSYGRRRIRMREGRRRHLRYVCRSCASRSSGRTDYGRSRWRRRRRQKSSSAKCFFVGIRRKRKYILKRKHPFLSSG